MTQKRITSKDLQISFLMGGLAEVNDSIKGSKTPGKKVWKDTLVALDAMGIEAGDLAAAVTAMFPASGKGRGKQQPVDGEKRTYSVQVVRNSAPFIRLPLSILGVERGQEVNVTFGTKSVRVTA